MVPRRWVQFLTLVRVSLLRGHPCSRFQGEPWHSFTIFAWVSLSSGKTSLYLCFMIKAGLVNRIHSVSNPDTCMMMRSLALVSDGSSTQGPTPGDSKRFSGVVPPTALVFLALVFVAGAIVTLTSCNF
ncbi:hypothetical protein ZWY2020_018354 [Hordeum vulgare]|nr:hypothetical protein ZWY2020_018354 [Hordeum vulgare]